MARERARASRTTTIDVQTPPLDRARGRLGARPRRSVIVGLFGGEGGHGDAPRRLSTEPRAESGGAPARQGRGRGQGHQAVEEWSEQRLRSRGHRLDDRGWGHGHGHRTPPHALLAGGGRRVAGKMPDGEQDNQGDGPGSRHNDQPSREDVSPAACHRAVRDGIARPDSWHRRVRHEHELARGRRDICTCGGGSHRSAGRRWNRSPCSAGSA
jgi:hypothetical protein